MDPSLPLDKTITGKTDFLITEHGALGTDNIAELRSRKQSFISGPILNLKDFGRLKFVQNTWAGVDSLARQLAGKKLYSHRPNSHHIITLQRTNRESPDQR